MKTLLLVIILAVASLSGLASAQSIYSVITPKSDVTVTSSATLIAAANPFRTALNVTNNSSSVAVRWGDSGVTASKGQKIPASATITIENQGAVYMISEGANVVVSVTEEER